MLLYSQVKGLRACVIHDYPGFVKNKLIGTLEPPQTHHPSQARGISAWTALRISLA
jgi:hypothetical protein